MKRLILFFSLLLCCITMNAQNEYYMRQAQSYQRDAEYYTKKAEGYDREVDYYNRQAQGYLREAEYYSKRDKYDQVMDFISVEQDMLQTGLHHTRNGLMMPGIRQDFI